MNVVLSLFRDEYRLFPISLLVWFMSLHLLILWFMSFLIRAIDVASSSIIIMSTLSPCALIVLASSIPTSGSMAFELPSQFLWQVWGVRPLLE